MALSIFLDILHKFVDRYFTILLDVIYHIFECTSQDDQDYVE